MSSTSFDRPACRMLLVEDDALLSRALGLLLESSFEVEAAVDGASALQSVARSRFDVALVDYLLPDTNGIALLQRLRALDPALRRVLTSGWLLPERHALITNGLLHAFLIKPAPIEEIVRVCRGTPARPQRHNL
jgi:DNA-binding NtrC family response regulator